MDERNFITILRYSDNSQQEQAPGEYLENEFEKLTQRRIHLDDWALLDDDVRWERYLLYLVQWAIMHNSDEDEGMSPLSYDEWRQNEG